MRRVVMPSSVIPLVLVGPPTARHANFRRGLPLTHRRRFRSDGLWPYHYDIYGSTVSPLATEPSQRSGIQQGPGTGPCIFDPETGP